MEIEHYFINVILEDLGLAEKNEVSVSDGREVFEGVNVSGDSFNIPSHYIECEDIIRDFNVRFVRSINI